MASEAPATASVPDRIHPGRLSRLIEALAAAPEVSPPPPLPSPGERLGRFVLLRELGRGGFGVVFEAEDLELHRRVALKLVRGARAAPGAPEEWMHREAEAAAQLQHPGIVTLHDAGHWNGLPYLVYERLVGQTLAERLGAGRLPEAQARQVLRGVAGALAHAHAAGVVHRDLKPQNVFLAGDGSVKILDFGLAQVAGAAGVAGGSPPYAAPEQWAGGQVDGRADVHAWGVMAAELLRPRRGGAVRRGTLRALAAAARHPEAARRPADGAALCALLDRLERRRRRLRLGAGLLVGALLGTLFGKFVLLREAPPPGPTRVALADAGNDTGDARLDGLSGLVRAGLSGSPRLEVLERARLGGALRAAGHPGAERLDARLAGRAARLVGAAVLLVPGARTEGGRWHLAIEARDPESGRRLFVLDEAVSGPEALFAGVDRLVRRARAALREREADIQATEVEVARAVSRSLEAYQRYHQGRLCVEQPSRGHSWLAQDCDAHFRAALDIDPDFALAHFELAESAFLGGARGAELRAVLEPALARAARMPAAYRDQLRVFEARAAGDDERAVELARQAAHSFPGDARASAALGGLLSGAGRLSEAVEPLERALSLDPGLEPALDHLVWALGRLDRVEALRALEARLAALPPTPGRLHARVLARGWAGDVAGALATAREAAAADGGAAAEDLADALVAAGRLDEAEPLVRAAAAREDAFIARSRLATFLLLQGRRREALAAMEASRAAAPDPRERFFASERDAYRLAGERDVGALHRLAAEGRAGAPDWAGNVAALLAYAGDAAAALELAPSSPGQPQATQLVEALVAWRQEGAAAALPRLRALAEGDPGGLGHALAPPEAISWLHAECAAEAAPDEEALRALRRFQRAWRPLGPWRAWAYPRSLVLEARLLEGLGHRAEAREALARLEALWARADPGQPLHSDMRALRRVLGGSRRDGVSPGPGSRGPPTKGEGR